MSNSINPDVPDLSKYPYSNLIVLAHKVRAKEIVLEDDDFMNAWNEITYLLSGPSYHDPADMYEFQALGVIIRRQSMIPVNYPEYALFPQTKTLPKKDID